MNMVALIMRPWIIMMRTVGGVKCYILADDVLILATGMRMIASLAAALNKTHMYLHAMGAKVAPAKSYNFASTVAATTWLKNTWWEHISAKTDVVKDFRYLGAHLTSGTTTRSPTICKRRGKAVNS